MSYDRRRPDRAGVAGDARTGAEFGRREVLVGATATALLSTSEAAAQTAQRPDIRLVRNPERTQEIGVAIEAVDRTGEKTAIVLYPKTFGGSAHPIGEARPTVSDAFVKASKGLSRFRFSDARFSDAAVSDRGRYSLEFTCEAKSKPNSGAASPAAGKAAGNATADLAGQTTASEWEISARFFRHGDGGKLPASDPVDLIEFLRGRVALLLPLTRSQAELLRWDLFGERVEVQRAGVNLALSLELPIARPSVVDPVEPSLRLVMTPLAGGEIWVLDGMARVDAIDITRADGDLGEGALAQERQEIERIHQAQRDGKPKSYRSRAWVGEATVAWKEPRPGDDHLNRYTIGRLEFPRLKPAVEIARLKGTQAKVTLRQWGNPRSTLAMMRGAFEVKVLGVGQNAKEAPPIARLQLAEALLIRQDRKERPPQSPPERLGDIANLGQDLHHTLTGHVDDKPFAIETPYGTLIVEGDPLKVDPAKGNKGKTDGKPPQHPLGREIEKRTDFALQPAKGLTQFQLMASGNALTFFDARARLRHLAVVLPNSLQGATRVEERAGVWSRLDFDGTEVAFRVSLTDPEQVWPSARSVVTLGEQPAELYGLGIPDGPAVGTAPAEGQGAKAAGSKASERERTSPGVVVPPPVWLALDGATLRVRRDSDNLALTYNFSRMVLELGKGGGRILPNLKMSGAGAGRSATGLGGTYQFDDRSLLIVGFPPQHVAEMAYYRQVNDGVELPDMPHGLVGGEAYANKIEAWRRLPLGSSKKRSDRKEIFDEEKKHLDDVMAGTSALKEQIKSSRLKEFLTLQQPDGGAAAWVSRVGTANIPASLLTRWNLLPEDQRAFYLGVSARAMDPDVRAVWLEIWRLYLATRQSQDDRFADAASILPDVELSDAVARDLELRMTASDGRFNPNVKADRIALASALNAERRRRSEEFNQAEAVYKKLVDKRPDLLDSEYSGTAALSEAWKVAKDSERDDLLKFVLALAKQWKETVLDENFKLVTPARLSGPSRLVFRFDPAGGTFDDRNVEGRATYSEATEGVRKIDFSVTGLTDWGRFDLAVTRRAETLEYLPGGRIAHPDLRGTDLDPARILAFQGIRPGSTIEGRLIDIQTSLYRPRPDETSIELPFRLHLSPDQFGRFRTRRPIDMDVLRPNLDGTRPARLEIAPVLWSANLQMGRVPPVVRAVWSDDFRPAAMAGAPAPARDVAAPWQRDRTRPFRASLDAYDRHEIVALSSVYGLPVMGRRNEVDSLIDASQFEPPDGYRLDKLKLYPMANGEEGNLSGIYNPQRLDVAELRLTAIGGSLRHDTAFVPPASAVRKGKGGNLFEAFSIERWRQVTVLGRDIEVEVVYKGFLFPLGVRASLIKLTERRFERNDQNGVVTAFLIQRKFIRIGNPVKTFPAVGQADKARRLPVVMLTMTTLETPDIVDPYLDGSPERYLLESLATAEVHRNGKVSFARPTPPALPGLCFWPRTKPGPRGNILFEFRLDTDAAPIRMPLIFVDNKAANDPQTMATLAEYYNKNKKGDPLTSVNRPLRTAKMGGSLRRYADENKDGECSFETYQWELQAEGRQRLTAPTAGPSYDNSNFAFDPLLQGSDQPPFYPFVFESVVRVGQAERFVGQTLPTQRVRFFEDYRRIGFPDSKAGPTQANAANYFESYLEVRGPAADEDSNKGLELDMGEAGDRAGGIGRPAMTVRYLSRRHGLMPDNAPSPSQVIAVQGAQSAPVSANQPKAAAPQPSFDLKGFFGNKAKLLGIISFADLLHAAGSAVPELKESVESATEETAEFLRQSVLPEIERALKSLEQMWEQARQGLAEQTGGRGPLTLEIDKLYPDIKPALNDLLDKLQLAKSAPNNKLVGALSEVQASGRKFVTALGRTLSDPVAPLREELSRKFRELRLVVEALGSDLAEHAKTAIDELKARIIKIATDDAIAMLAAEKPFARLIFSLPVPSTDEGKAAVELAEILDQAVAKGAGVFLKSLSKKSLDAPDVEAALREGLSEAQKLLKDPGTLSSTAKKVLEDYAKEAADLAANFGDAGRSRLLRVVPGVVQPLLFGDSGVVREMARDADKLRDEVLRHPDKALEIAAKFIGDALRRASSLLVASAREEFCGAIVAKATQVATDCFISASNGLAQARVAIERIVPNNADLKKAFEEFGEIRKLLDAGTLASFCASQISPAAGGANDALSSVVTRALAELSIKKDTVLKQLRVQLEAEAENLATAEWAQIKPMIDAIALFAIGPHDAVVRSLTALDTALASFEKPKSAIERELATQVQELRAKLAVLKSAFETMQRMFVVAQSASTGAEAIEALRAVVVVLSGAAKFAAKPVFYGAREKLLTAFEKDAEEARKIVEAGVAATIDDIERELAVVVGRVMLAGVAVKDAAIVVVGRMLAPLFTLLQDKVYDTADTLRKKGREELEKAKDRDFLQRILKFLRGPNGQELGELFTVGAVEGGKDQLDRDIAALSALIAVDPKDKYVERLVAIVESWTQLTASPVLLLRNIDYVLTAILKGELAQFVDLRQIRRQVDEAIRSMVPSRIHRSYDLKLRLDKVGELINFDDSQLGLPRSDPKGLPGTLVLHASGVVDLQQPKNSTVDAIGHLPAFALKLLPGFDVATFIFPPATFTGGLGKPFDLSLKVEKVILGDKVSFLQKLESLFGAPKNGSGFYLRPMVGRGGVGIVAGYALPIAPITLGNMYIDNLSLNAAAELPFDGGDARFVISLSRPDAQFMIAAAPYAGAGHLGLIANPKGIIGFEASFSYGGGGGFAYGPLSGRGRISVGVFIRQMQGLTELYGTFYAGGSARIACFGIGAQLSVRLGQTKDGNAEGDAIFTYSFSLGFKDIEFSVTVFKRENGSGERRPGARGTGRNVRRQQNKATPVTTVPVADETYARLINATWCKGEHYGTYSTYFSKRSTLSPGRTVLVPMPPPAKPPSAAARKIWIMS